MGINCRIEEVGSTTQAKAAGEQESTQDTPEHFPPSNDNNHK